MYVEVPLGERIRMWYLHDGAVEWLNNLFLTQWVGKNGPVA